MFFFINTTWIPIFSVNVYDKYGGKQKQINIDHLFSTIVAIKSNVFYVNITYASP